MCRFEGLERIGDVGAKAVGGNVAVVAVDAAGHVQRHFAAALPVDLAHQHRHGSGQFAAVAGAEHRVHHHIAFRQPFGR